VPRDGYRDPESLTESIPARAALPNLPSWARQRL